MAGNSLKGVKINQSYNDMLRVSNANSGVDSFLRPILDGAGNALPIKVSVSSIVISAGAWQGDAIGVAYGGTGVSSISSGGILIGNGALPVSVITGSAAGDMLRWTGSAWVASSPNNITGGFVKIVPSASSDNVIAPTVADVTSLRVRLTTGTFGSAFDIFGIQNSSSGNIFSVRKVSSSLCSIYINTNLGFATSTGGFLRFDNYSGFSAGSLDLSASSTGTGGSINMQAGSNGNGGNIRLQGNRSNGGTISAIGSDAYDPTPSGNAGSLLMDARMGTGGKIDIRGGGFNKTVLSGPDSPYGGSGGEILMYGGNGRQIGTSYGGNAGSIWTYGNEGAFGGINGKHGGSIRTNAGPTTLASVGGTGGSIFTNGGSAGGNGGSINMSGGDNGAVNGGSLLMYGAACNGGIGGTGGSIATYGGASSDAQDGGDGGGITLVGGDATSDAVGGNGGSINLRGGNALVANAGGNGGNITSVGSQSGSTVGYDGGSIDLSANTGGSGGSINMYASATTGGSAGSLNTYGFGNSSGGDISTFAGTGSGANGGTFLANGGSGDNAAGGMVRVSGGSGSSAIGGTADLKGGSSSGATGGNLDLHGGTLAGGSINCADGGGSINTTGATGSIQLGYSATRTTINGSGSAVTITLPAVTGTLMSLAGTQTITGDKTFNGLLTIPTVAGTPTGTPANGTIKYDTTAHKFWVYDSGWKSVTLS